MGMGLGKQTRRKGENHVGKKRDAGSGYPHIVPLEGSEEVDGLYPVPGYLPQWQSSLWADACPGMPGRRAWTPRWR